MPPAIVFQGRPNTTVRRINGPRIAEQWIAFAGQAGRAPEPGPALRRRPCPTAVTSRHTWWGRTMFEYWQVDGLGHAWSGGTEGGSYSDPAAGPSASAAMWKFFAGRKLRSRTRRPDR